jgi:hypothetical protein
MSAPTPMLKTREFIMADPIPDSEQRKHVRYECVDGGIMRLSVRPEFRGRRAILVDLSGGGIGFLVEEPLESGAMLVFELQGPGDLSAMTRVARVCHCRPHPTPSDAPWATKPPVLSKLFRQLLRIQQNPTAIPTSWLIGCAFEKPLDEADLQLFLERLKLVREFGEL